MRDFALLPCLLLLLVVSASAQSVDIDPPAQESSSRESLMGTIRDAVTTRHNAVDGIDVTYRRTLALVGSREEPETSRHHYVVQGIFRFRENTHFTEQFPVEIDLNHTRQYYTGTEANAYLVKQRHCEATRNIRKFSPSLGKVKFDFYMDASGWWPEQDHESPNPDYSNSTFLRFVLANERYQIKERLEDVCGHDCHVIENPGVDRLWLDPSVGYGVRKREIFDPTTGAVVRSQLTDVFERYQVTHGEVIMEVWFPWHIDITETIGADDPERVDSKNKVKMITGEMQVESLRVNTVSRNAFEYVPVPGDVVLDRDTGRSRQIPGGRELMDQSVAIVKEIESRINRLKSTDQSQPIQGAHAVMLRVAGIAGVILFVFSLWYRKCLRSDAGLHLSR